MPLLNWFKRNKITTLLLIIVVYFVLKSAIGTPISLLRSGGYGNQVESLANPSVSSFGAATGKMGLSMPSVLPPQADYAPQTNVNQRLVIENSNLSLLVKDVVDSRNKIVTFAQQNGGYMVTSSVANPQDAPTGSVVVRIPSTQLNQALEYFHSLSIKVVSENLDGTDVTDQYVDTEARIATLEKTKAKYQSILDSAHEISDITNLAQQILQIQSQIDSLKGQQEALTKNAQLSKITIYLSTDEIALPYAPSETFRPAVIFKLAVRSLISQLRALATWLIWIAVYGVIWIPALILFVWAYWKWGNKLVSSGKDMS